MWTRCPEKDARSGRVRPRRRRGPELREDAVTDCVPFLRDIDFPMVYALAGCGRRCATKETARFQSRRMESQAPASEQQFFLIGDWPYQ